MEWIFLCKEVVLAGWCWLVVLVWAVDLSEGCVRKEDTNFAIFIGFLVAILAGLMTWESIMKFITILE